LLWVILTLYYPVVSAHQEVIAKTKTEDALDGGATVETIIT
jgi:hypothetical protein